MMNKETIKEFLKPNWKKIIVFVILLALTFTHPRLFTALLIELPICNTYHYFTKEVCFLDFYRHGSFEYAFLIIIWYFISCLIICAYNKLKTKK